MFENTKPSPYDWIIPSSTESKNLDALTNAQDSVDLVTSISGERQQLYEEKFFFLFGSNDGSDVLTSSNLRQMCETESSMATDPQFPNFCRLDSNGNCILPPTSIVVHFYSFTNLTNWKCSTLSDSDVEAKRNSIYSAGLTAAGQEKFGFWLSSDFPTKGYSTRVESIWSFGAPLKGYKTVADNWEDQREKYQNFVADQEGKVGGVEKSLFAYFDIKTNADNLFPYYPTPYMSTANTANLEVQWYSLMNRDNEFSRLLLGDMYFAIFSIMFVYIWIRVHTGATFIAGMGMFMIMTSLPTSILIYKGIYGIPYFSELHTLVIFIVLGVGADDIFVLVDSWKHTAVIFPGEIGRRQNMELTHRRLYHCYLHTMATVFNTSFTTSMAFIATGFSPLMPISTFGWFAATAIIMNYLFVITLMPAVLIVNEYHFKHWTCFGLCPEKQDGEAPSSTASISYDAMSMPSSDEGLELADVSVAPSTLSQMSEPERLSSLRKATSSVASTRSPMVEGYIKFIEGTSCVAADNSKNTSGAEVEQEIPGTDIESAKDNEEYSRPFPTVAIILVTVLLSFGIFGAYYGATLQPPSQQEVWFPKQHMFTIAEDTIINDFLGFDDASYEQLTLMFGISGIDRSGFNQYIPNKNRGSAIYDANYDLSKPSCQKVMEKMCSDIQTYACDAAPTQPSGLLARYNTTECFMTSFRKWAPADTYSMSSTDFYSNLTSFRETQLQTEDTGASWQDQIGFINGQLKYATIFFTTTMEVLTPLTEKLDVLGCIDNFIGKVRAYPECSDCGCDSLRFAGDFAFQWMRTEEGLLLGFYQGMLIAFPVAFCVLIFATGNIFVSLYAISSVFFIVFGVLGFVNYSLGWDLGVAESIAGIIIIGFSVDYTVHLGHMYTHANELGLQDRISKFEYASRKMVATIVGGAITTAGAGIFMFPCQLQFFVKMATLIVSTIIMSYIYALLFFMSVLYIAGPGGESGNIRHTLSCFFPKKETDQGQYPVPTEEDKYPDDESGSVRRTLSWFFPSSKKETVQRKDSIPTGEDEK
jgi:hypothetical protein